jgi:hypothetical protein
MQYLLINPEIIVHILQFKDRITINMKIFSINSGHKRQYKPWILKVLLSAKALYLFELFMFNKLFFNPEMDKNLFVHFVCYLKIIIRHINFKYY